MALNLNFKDLSFWQQSAFAAALLERMLPNYQMFAQAADFGDFDLLRNQLNLIWQLLGQGQIKISYAVQLEKLEEAIPEVDDFDFFGVHPALDTCMALGSLLQGMQDQDADPLGNVSELSLSGVSYYIGLILAEQQSGQTDIVIQQQDIDDHPLMQWELASQQELFNAVKAAKENNNSCQQLKELALAEGLSNLGIEL